MTKILSAACAFIFIIFLASCNQKPEASFKKAMAQSSASDSITLDASMYLLYIKIDIPNSLDTLINLPGTDKLVFKCFFDTSSKMTLVAYGGGSGHSSFDQNDAPVMNFVTDSSVSHKHFGRNIYIGDQEIDKKKSNDLNQLKNYLKDSSRKKYIIFIPTIVPVDGHTERNMLMYNLYPSQTLPTSQASYDSLMNMNFQQKNLSAGGAVPTNPCPPRCN
jgi:hypothetical protein